MNSRVTPKERGLLKGAVRRVFSRSELRRKIIEASEVKHSDPSRPRVKKWCLCAACNKPEAKSYCVADHIEPVIPIDSSFEEMGLDLTVDRMWCKEDNLQTICPSCHDEKTKIERKQRKAMKNDKKSKSNIVS